MLTGLRTRLSLVLIWFGIFCLLAASCEMDRRRHDVRVPVTSYYAGNVPVGRWIKHSFVIQNMTLHPITVEAMPECGCTTVANPEPLRPLQTTTVGAFIDTSGEPAGFHSTEIDVALTDAQQTWRTKLRISYFAQ